MKTRAASFVAWTRAHLAGTATAEQVERAVRGMDESVEVRSETGQLLTITNALSVWVAEGWGAPSLALPVPGDPRGLAGPGPSTVAALEAREAVVSARMVLVPTVEAYGNAIEGFTTLSTWQLFALEAAHVALPRPGVREADRDLRAAMLEAVEALSRQTQSQWSPELAEAVADIRTLRKDGEPFASSLPTLYSPAARELVARAMVIQRIVELADPSTSPRELALLAGAVRNAVCAGINEDEEAALAESQLIERFKTARARP